ncbi:hypothetical protein Tco_0250958 [Tanacetum coccineum]
MVAYLEKSEESEGFHQIIDFLTASHIKNALIECPTLYAYPIEQFWQTAALSINEDGDRGITATIDRKVKKYLSNWLSWAEEDPSNQGRSLIEELDLDAGISLVPPHAEDQGRFDETQISDQPEEQRREVSTGSGGVSIANRLVSTADISTANELDSTAGVKEKDKGKAIMHEFNAEHEARFKAEQEQERIDFEITLELQKQLDEKEKVAAKVDEAHDID